ncbi:MAG: hypothetical protein WB714_03220 [Candidatus Sulfotelmatobacter sp.]
MVAVQSGCTGSETLTLTKKGGFECLSTKAAGSRWPAENWNGPEMTMQHKLDRNIAVLEVEAKMLESHAEKLSIMARQLAEPDHQREIIKLSHEETEKAEGIRRQIRLLKDHL